MFSEKDIQHIHNQGITINQVNKQIERLKNGMLYANIIAAATLGKGIESYNKKDIKKFIELYETKQNQLSIVKFVPASGAATRMFKYLFEFLEEFKPLKEDITSYTERKNNTAIDLFINNLQKFPFYDKVLNQIKTLNPEFDTLPDNVKHVAFIKTMLNKNNLNLSALPKGLLPFHRYHDKVVTAFYEHLFEASLYSSSNQEAHIHFTVSKKHHNHFIDELNKIKDSLQLKTNTTFKVSFSYQKKATATIALTTKGSILRKKNGSIVFRPAGHGALLENLNKLNYDLIFIKNIDNIEVSHKSENTAIYKKLLAGILLDAQQTSFSFLHKLDKGNLTDSDFKAMILFLKERLNLSVSDKFESLISSEKIRYLKKKLNKPMRVCGMVRNEGEPGGGPFWVKDDNNQVSLQIVEFAQINFSKKNQQSLVYKATHFNPTDLVCAVKNYKGEKFDLTKYVDHNAAFITLKTSKGVTVKALELPGLWNGSMAHWNSIFVEVPSLTFNPVKTVNDLLKPAHQAS